MEYGNNYSFGGFGGDGSGQAKDLKIQSGKERGDTKAYVTVFRIAPPILSGREFGRIVIYEPKHWGYSGVNRRDPTKPTARTFLCTRERDFRENVITQECAECLLIEESEKRLLQEIVALLGLKDDGKLRWKELYGAAIAKASGAQQSMMASLYKFLAGDNGIGSHSLDGKPWKLNAWSETDQEAGFLRLSGSNWRQIKARKSDERDSAKQGLIDKWISSGVDPIAPDQGLFFQLTRIGNGSGMGTAKDKIEIVTEPIDPARPAMGSRPKMAPITEKMDAAFATCRDLTDCSPSVRLSAALVAQLVDLYRRGENSPEAVDEIFAAGRRAAAPVDRAGFRPAEAPREEIAAFQPQAAPVQQPVAQVVAVAPVVSVAPSPPVVQVAAPPIAIGMPSLTPEEQEMINILRSGKKRGQ